MTEFSVSPKEAYDLDAKYVFHSWSAQANRTPLTITKSEGSYIWDINDKKILDFSSQLVNTNIGHQHPYVVEAIKKQAEKICTVAPQHVNDQRSMAAKKVIDHSPSNMKKVFFTNGGAESVEHAIRMARVVTGRFKVASLFRSYHGATSTAINATGDARRWKNDNPGAGVVHFHGPFLYRSEFYASNEQEECKRALDHLEKLICFEGPDLFAAVLLESIPGTVGIMPPPPGYLEGVRKICDKYGIMMILDEVMSGFGRTGKWLAMDHWDAKPDLITFAKGVNSGYIPLGGIILGDKVSDYFDDIPYPGGLTYSGHPLACASAVATIELMENDKIVENAASIGEDAIAPGLEKLKSNHKSIGDIRGMGVFWAIELVKDQATKEPLAPYGSSSPVMAKMYKSALEKGLLIFHNYNRIHVVPPCTVNKDEIEEGMAILDDVLTIADQEV